MMKIAVFSTADISGGAGRATSRLNYGLLNNREVNMSYYVQSKKEDINTTKILTKENNIDIERMIQNSYINNSRTNLTNTLFSFSYSDVKLPSLDAYAILNLHWVEQFLSLHNLYELTKANKPIVWTLHDMKPFTGGCHYSAGCENFISNCEKCSQLIDDPYNLASKVLNLKRLIFNNANLTIVVPSIWLAKEAQSSALFKNKRIEVIANSIDSTVFKATKKQEAKKELGIDESTIVLTFGVVNHNEERKGFSKLVEAIELLKKKIFNKKIVALFFGSSCSHNFPIPFINIGQIDDEQRLAIVYSAADIFILPSLEDNLPNTILESLSCETPIIAFDTGGAKDIICNNNGKIVQKGNVLALSNEIYNLIINKELREEKGRNGRRLILEKYQLHHQSYAYIKLFKELIDENFNYVENKLDVNSTFDSLIGYLKSKNLMDFSIKYNSFFSQFELLKDLNLKYVVYGHGTIGKTLQALMPNNILCFVDKKSVLMEEKIMAGNVYSPYNLKNISFDKIIISVLGREEEIINDLVNNLHITQEKIVCFSV